MTISKIPIRESAPTPGKIGIPPGESVNPVMPPTTQPSTPELDPTVSVQPPPTTGPEGTTLQQLLDEVGLGSLAGWAWAKYTAGETIDQIMLEMRSTPEYKQRWSGLITLQGKGRAISEAEGLSIEKQFAQILNQGGIASNMFGQQDFQDWIGQEKSPNEISQRVQSGYLAVAMAPPDVRAYFAQTYGAQGDSMLASYFLDPDKAAPVLLEQAQAAQIGGTGQRFGLGIGRSTAEQLASMGLTQADAQSGFEAIANEAPLFKETVSESTDLTPEGTGVNAQFGLDPTARQAIQNRLLQRTADVQGQTAIATRDNQGASLIGSAGRK